MQLAAPALSCRPHGSATEYAIAPELRSHSAHADSIVRKRLKMKPQRTTRGSLGVNVNGKSY